MLNYQRVNDFPQGSQKHVYMEYNMILIDDIDVLTMIMEGILKDSHGFTKQTQQR